MTSFQKILFSCSLFILSTACSDTDDADCELVLCAPNQVISLELLVDGTNVLADRTYTLEDISVTGTNDEELNLLVRESEFGGPEALLEISSFDWKVGSYSYLIRLGNDWMFQVEVEFTSSSDPCCRQFLIIRELTSPTLTVLKNTSYFTIILPQ